MLGLMVWRVSQADRRSLPFQDRLIAAANSPAGRRARILGGTMAVLVALRLRGWAGAALALAGALAAVPALWGFCV